MNTTWGQTRNRNNTKRKRTLENKEEESIEDINIQDLPLFNLPSNTNETISKKQNHLYFYDDVNTLNNLKFTKLLREIDNDQQVKVLNGEITEPTIHIHINSGGGNLLDGFSMASSVNNCKSHTICYCEGIVASAATLPLVICDERKMQQYCYILIHQLSSGFWGTYEKFSDEKTNLDNFMKQLTNIYSEYTDVPKRKLREILKHDLFWDYETCLKYNIVDSMC